VSDTTFAIVNKVVKRIQEDSSLIIMLKKREIVFMLDVLRKEIQREKDAGDIRNFKLEDIEHELQDALNNSV
jgi:hypothetical protein